MTGRPSPSGQLAAGFLAASAIVFAQPQDPTFRATTQTVSIYATVTDADGRLVPDLSREDFTVLDNDQPQTIAVFDNGVQPITAAIMRDMSGSMLPARDLTDAAVRKFIASLTEADRACYGVFGGSVLVSRKLTGDHDELLQALAMPLPALRDGTALWDAVSVGMQLLYHQPGRRVVLALTDGGDNRSEIDVNKLEDVIVRDEFMLYMVGMTTRSGLQDPPRDLRRAAGVGSTTGGGYFYVRPSDDLDAVFHRISDELHHQYLLGFTPAKLDGKIHKLDLKVNRAELTARSRKSYVASNK
jgi:VWFA-related protein